LQRRAIAGVITAPTAGSGFGCSSFGWRLLLALFAHSLR